MNDKAYVYEKVIQHEKIKTRTRKEKNENYNTLGKMDRNTNKEQKRVRSHLPELVAEKINSHEKQLQNKLDPQMSLD